VSLYDDLGVTEDASTSEIRGAFIEKIKQQHPDKPDGDTEATKQLNLAYSILKDEKKRAQYDATGTTDTDLNNSPAQQAQRKLAMMLQTMLSQQIDFEHFDLVGTMKKAVKAEQDKASSTLHTFEKERKKLVLVKKKFKAVGKASFLEESVAQQSRQLEDAVGQVENEQEVLSICEELLYDVMFEFTEKPVTLSPMATSSTLTWTGL